MNHLTVRLWNILADQDKDMLEWMNSVNSNTNSAIKTVCDGVNNVIDNVNIMNSTLLNKVDKVSGKGLSSNDYTTVEKNKLQGIKDGATKTEASTTNGYVKINGVDSVVYTHPQTHAASMITEDATHKFVTDEEKVKLGKAISVDGIIAGNNVIIDRDITNNTVTISSIDSGSDNVTWGDVTNKPFSTIDRDIIDTTNNVLSIKDGVFASESHKHDDVYQPIGDYATTSQIPDVSNKLEANNIKAGNNVTVSVSGNDITINATGGSGDGGGTYSSWDNVTDKPFNTIDVATMDTSNNVLSVKDGIFSLNEHNHDDLYQAKGDYVTDVNVDDKIKSHNASGDTHIDIRNAIPTMVSQLDNDSEYATVSQIPDVSNKIEIGNIKAGTNVTLSVEGNDVTISSDVNGEYATNEYVDKQDEELNVKITTLSDDIGDKNSLVTTNKDNIVSAMNEVFQCVSSGKTLLETTIIDKGGEVSKECDVATFNEINESILDLELEDFDGKMNIIKNLILKLPSLESKIDENSTLSELAFYILLLGEQLIPLSESYASIDFLKQNGVATLSSYLCELITRFDDLKRNEIEEYYSPMVFVKQKKEVLVMPFNVEHDVSNV